MLLFMLATGAAVSFMAGVVATLVVTRPPVMTDEQWIDAMARRDRRMARP